MNRLKLLTINLTLLGAAFLFSIPGYGSVTAGDITGGAKAPHVNIAIFHKLHGHDAYIYPERIKARDILGATKGEAQFISINHTAGLKDGDVVSISNDVLRSSEDSFQDFGVNCRLAIHVKGTVTSISGLCEMLMVDQDGREIAHSGLVKSVDLKAGQNWVLVYNDKEDGIAVYVEMNIGME